MDAHPSTKVWAAINRSRVAWATIAVAVAIGATVTADAAARTEAATRVSATATSTQVLRVSDNVYNCVFLAAGVGISFGAGVSPYTALGIALSAREAGGCATWMASAICRASYFWGPFGAPYRWVISVVTRGRANHC